MTIQAIPTILNGIEYRSRLEARWAMFFHLAGYTFQYEPNGEGTAPDFHVNGIGLIEIKPTPVVTRYLQHLYDKNVRYLTIGGFYRGRKPSILELTRNGLKRVEFKDMFPGANQAYKTAKEHRFDLCNPG